MTRMKMTMCYSRFCELASEAKELGAKMISPFGYGEPLMDGELAAKIEYVTELGLDSFITSNCSWLDSDTSYDLLRAGLKNIRFSFHATNAVDYRRVHRLDWIETLSNFGEFRRINKRLGSPCKVHITAMSLSGESVETIRNTWERYCDYLEIWKPHNWGGAKHFRETSVARKVCGRPFSGPVQVQADGTVIPCCFLTNSEVVLGDTNLNTLREVITGAKYEDFRTRHLTCELSGLPCEECEQRNVGDSPLVYSNRDATLQVGVTSTCKMSVQ